MAADLEINKAVMFLKQKQLMQAIVTLKAFEKDSNIAINAAVNLSFIYYLVSYSIYVFNNFSLCIQIKNCFKIKQGDLENALKYSEVINTSPTKIPEGYVNYGVCLMTKDQLDEATTAFKKALDLNDSHFEAIYNLGLVLKRQGYYPDALTCFQRFSGSLALIPAVVYHIAHLLELIGDTEAAAETYQQLLGLAPSDATALQKLGELYDHEGDKQQAHHYHIDVIYLIIIY